MKIDTLDFCGFAPCRYDVLVLKCILGHFKEVLNKTIKIVSVDHMSVAQSALVVCVIMRNKFPRLIMGESAKFREKLFFRKFGQKIS